MIDKIRKDVYALIISSKNVTLSILSNAIGYYFVNMKHHNHIYDFVASVQPDVVTITVQVNASVPPETLVYTIKNNIVTIDGDDPTQAYDRAMKGLV